MYWHLSASAHFFVRDVLALTPSGADEPKKDLGPRPAAEAFLEAALAGRAKEAAALGEPGTAYSREEKCEEFAELNPKNLALGSRDAGDEHALAITEKVKGDRGRAGRLVRTLVKKDKRWLIRDVDLESEDSAKKKLKRFLD